MQPTIPKISWQCSRFSKKLSKKKGSIFLCSLRTLFFCLYLHVSVNRTVPFFDYFHCLLDLVLPFVLCLSSLVTLHNPFLFCTKQSIHILCQCYIVVVVILELLGLKFYLLVLQAAKALFKEVGFSCSCLC